jgi:hypothetical protein
LGRKVLPLPGFEPWPSNPKPIAAAVLIRSTRKVVILETYCCPERKLASLRGNHDSRAIRVFQTEGLRLK